MFYILLQLNARFIDWSGRKDAVMLLFKMVSSESITGNGGSANSEFEALPQIVQATAIIDKHKLYFIKEG